MAVTLGASGITFSDSTSQTTTPTGGRLVGNSDKGDLIKIESFNSSGTWTNPGATTVHVKLIVVVAAAQATAKVVELADMQRDS